MADLPTHRSTKGEDEEGPAGRRSAGGRDWKPVMGIAVAVAIIVLLVLLHATGVIGVQSH